MHYKSNRLVPIHVQPFRKTSQRFV